MKFTQAAGLAKLDITPEKPEFLGGYAARDKRSEGISDRLYVRAGAFRDETGKRLVIVSADTLEIPKAVSERIHQTVLDRFGLGRDQVILNVIHTHCAPILYVPQFAVGTWKLDPDYVELFVSKTVEAVGKALDDLAPAKIFFGMTSLKFGINRRLKTANGIEMRPNPEGFTIDDIPVLEIRREGRPGGVFYSMDCHPTSRGGQLVSADYPGFAAKHFGEGFLAFLQGACGSAKPRIMTPDSSSFTTASPEWLENAGETIASCLKSSLASGKMHEIRLKLGYRIIKHNLKLDEARVPTVESFEKTAEENKAYGCYRKTADFYEKQLAEHSYRTELPVETGFARLSNDVGFLTFSGEITAEAAENMMKAVRRPGETMFLLGYCEYLAAYIPAEFMLPEGGYEALDSQYYYGSLLPFAPGIDKALAESAKKAYFR